MLQSQNRSLGQNQAEDLVHRYFDAWNQYDVPVVAGFFTNGGVYVDIPTNRQYSGPGLVRYISSFLEEEDARSHYDLVGDVLVGTHAVAFEYRYEIDADGRRGVPLAGAEFWTLLERKMIRVDDYYESRAPAVKRTEEPGPKYVKSGLGSATAGRYRRRLSQLMDEEKIYLRPDMSLPELARMVCCSVNHLSQVINAEFGKSFFEFLNHRRIADAKQLLANEPGCKVLDVALRVGFNSSSTFYAAFKTSCNLTPAQFRRQAAGPDQ